MHLCRSEIKAIGYSGFSCCSLFLMLLFIAGCRAGEQSSIPELDSLNLTETLQISADQMDVLFGDFSGLAVDRSGNIYTADRRLQKVHIFSGEGDYLDSFGREGQGPGEFVRMDRMLRMISDTLYIKDSGTNRITLYDGRSRQLAGTISIPENDLDNIPMGRSRDMYPLEDGTILLSFINPYFQAPEEENDPHKMTISTIDKNGEFVNKNVLQYEVLFPTDQTVVLLSGGINIMGGLAFYPTTKISMDPGGHLFIGNSDSLSIKKYNQHGQYERVIQANPPVHPFTNVHLDSLSETSENPSYRSLLDDIFQTAYRPGQWPVFDYFLFDDAGYCWVKLKHPGNPQQSWWVFDHEGEAKWEFRLDAEVDLYDIRKGEAYGIRNPPGEMQTIVRYRVEGM